MLSNCLHQFKFPTDFYQFADDLLAGNIEEFKSEAPATIIAAFEALYKGLKCEIDQRNYKQDGTAVAKIASIYKNKSLTHQALRLYDLASSLNQSENKIISEFRNLINDHGIKFSGVYQEEYLNAFQRTLLNPNSPNTYLQAAIDTIERDIQNLLPNNPTWRNYNSYVLSSCLQLYFNRFYPEISAYFMGVMLNTNQFSIKANYPGITIYFRPHPEWNYVNAQNERIYLVLDMIEKSFKGKVEGGTHIGFPLLSHDTPVLQYHYSIHSSLENFADTFIKAFGERWNDNVYTNNYYNYFNEKFAELSEIKATLAESKSHTQTVDGINKQVLTNAIVQIEEMAAIPVTIFNLMIEYVGYIISHSAERVNDEHKLLQSTASLGVLLRDEALKLGPSDEKFVSIVSQAKRLFLVNASGLESKKTALHRAAQNANFQKAQTLIEAGADKNCLDKGGETPYAIASKKHPNNLFLKNILEPNQSDDEIKLDKCRLQ